MQFNSFIILLCIISSRILFATGLGDGIIVENARANYEFGQSITFEATFRSENPVKEIYIFISAQGDDTVSTKIIPNSQGDVIYRLDLKKTPIRPFTPVSYWYQVLLGNNTNYKTEIFSFIYKDNRFTWQTTESTDFKIHWYNRDLTFGQLALSTSIKALANANTYLNILPSGPISIYIYNSSNDYLSAISNSSRPWIAGNASPDINTILLSIPTGPEQKLELERQVPHEIMHILQYQASGSAFRQLPVWLMEGLSSISELYPNPEYHRVLIDAVENRKLLSMSQLCASFPTDASGAFLAYAQSSSFLQYIYQTYGSNGIRRLIQEYQNGLGCEEAVLSTFGTSLTQVELRWQQKTLKMDPYFDIAQKILPFGVLGLLIAIPMLVVGITLSRSKNFISRQ